MKRGLIQFTIALLAGMPNWASAGGSEVVVVYNSRMPESKAVAEYYAKMRQVPRNQIYGFALTTNEQMTRLDFRDSLQLPLARDLEADGLWKIAKAKSPGGNGQPDRLVSRVVASKIRYAVLCYGVPLVIQADPDLQEPANPNLPSGFRRNEAAVDSELAWLPRVDENLPLNGPLLNWVYGTTNLALLSPTNGILLVSRLDGPSAAIARGLVDKSLEAERDGLWGRGYFDARGLTTETNLLIGDEWILGAARIWQDLGFDTVVDDKPALFALDFPMSQIAFYAGWYSEHPAGPFQLPKVEFMPGAFAYHLHSFSACTLRSTNDFWCGPLLAKGATCTMGCVTEPYLVLTPNIAVFLARFSISQFSFGEAAWAAQPALSWQTTVVGDPLYRPFAKTPQQLQDDLARSNNPLIEWSYARIANVQLLHGTPAPQVADFLENLPATANSAVLTEKLADLDAMQGKPSSAIDTYQLALQRNPSPEQRIRIRLALADQLGEAKRRKEAYADLQKILDENPDYPDKFSILKRLLDLAVALGDKDEITRCVNDMQKNGPNGSK